MNDQKSFLLSKTLWGLVFAAFAPWLSKKFGIVLDDASQQVVLDEVIQGVGLLFAAYGRVVAKHDVTVPVVKPPVGLIALATAVWLTAGCATLNPSADPVEVRAEQTVSIAFSTFDTFLKIESQQEARLITAAPGVVKFADWLREPTPGGLPRGLSIIESANNVRRAYKANRSAENRASLISALAAVESALSETNKQLTNSR